MKTTYIQYVTSSSSVKNSCMSDCRLFVHDLCVINNSYKRNIHLPLWEEKHIWESSPSYLTSLPALCSISVTQNYNTIFSTQQEATHTDSYLLYIFLLCFITILVNFYNISSSHDHYPSFWVIKINHHLCSQESHHLQTWRNSTKYCLVIAF